MFAKLLKYEWRSNANTFWILSAAAVGVSILGGIILRTLTQSGNQMHGAGVMSLATLLFFIFLSLIAYDVAIWIMLLVRFYKNKFTDEGYLTFTLPVNSHQIFLSSLLNMLVWSAICAIVVALGVGFILGIGLSGMDLSVLDEVDMIYDSLYPDSYWVLSLLGVVLSGIFSCVMSMTCLTVGSVIAKKHKILAAFGIYYGITMIMSIFESILTVVVSLDTLTQSNQYISQLAVETSLISMAVQLVIIVIGYFSSTYLMRRELNLS